MVFGLWMTEINNSFTGLIILEKSVLAKSTHTSKIEIDISVEKELRDEQ